METTPKFKAMADYRDLRSEPQRLEIDIPLRAVDPVDAPVAALVMPTGYFRPRPGRSDAEIRVLDGRLYQQPLSGAGEPATPGSVLADVLVGTHFGTAETLEAAERHIIEGVSRLITIDGEIWIRIDEPCLVVDRHGYSIDVLQEAPAGTRAWQIFSLREGSAAEWTAREHGPSSFPATAGVRILIPEAFTGMTSAARREAAVAEAEAEAAKAVALLADITPDAIHAAARILEAASVRLSAETDGGR